jgi:hypothetical protein
MDHLPLPVDKLAHPMLKIPYVCNERFSYDDNGFLTYPDRCGVDIWQLCEHDQIDSDDWAPFLQAWLWFGLLGETIGIGSRTHIPQRITSSASFIEPDEDGKRFLVTKDLRKFIEAASVKNRTPIFNAFHRERFDACLAATTGVLKQILSSRSCSTRLAKANRFIDLSALYSVLLSVQILVETLYASRILLFPSQPLSIIPSPVDLRPGSELVDILLKDSGWCPSHIRTLSRDVTVRYYLSYLCPFGSAEHGKCSKDGCRRIISEEMQIQPFHTSIGCACSSISIPESEVVQIAEEGDIPLLTFSELFQGQRRLEITRYSKNQNTSDQSQPFVAISHVRQIGLGNQKTHSLPYCQLSSLQMIANELLGAYSKPTPFWIDTACLPLRRDLKKRALRNIHRVYQSATKVIILDPSLFQFCVGCSQDALFRIRYSPWKSRLWTLQEGVLAKELHVKFQNRTFRLNELVEQYEKSAPHLLTVSSTLQDIDNDRLNFILASFDKDIKMVIADGNLEVDQHRIRTILRLGYLASPLYRYFCEDWERENSIHVIHALLQVYSSHITVRNSEKLVTELDALGSAMERVRQMSEIQITEGSW